MADRVRLSVRGEDLPALEYVLRFYLDTCESSVHMKDDGWPQEDVEEQERLEKAVEKYHKRIVRAMG